MNRWRVVLGRRRTPSRAGLIDRKRQLEGEMNVLRSQLRRLAKRGADTSDVERRLDQAQQRHHLEIRLEIDRTRA